MSRNTKLFLALGLLALCGCARKNLASRVEQPQSANIPLRESWNYNPSIERGLEILVSCPSGEKLARRLPSAGGTSIAYSDIKGPWSKYDPETDRVLIPEYTRGLDFTAGMEAAFGMALRQSYNDLGLEDFSVELFQMASIKRVEAALELGIPFRESQKTPAGRQLLDEACVLLYDGQRTLLEELERRALVANPEYGFPYEKMEGIIAWLHKADSPGEETFEKVMYRWDQERARRGVITLAKANSNALRLASLTPEEQQFMQRDKSFSLTRKVGEARRKYSAALSDNRVWTKKNAALLEQRAAEMIFCNFRIRAN